MNIDKEYDCEWYFEKENVDVALFVEDGNESAPIADFNAKHCLGCFDQHVLSAVQRVVDVENDSSHDPSGLR